MKKQPLRKAAITLYTVAEIAKQFHCTPTTVRMWIQDRHLSAFKIGKCYRVTGEAVGDFVARHERIQDLKADLLLPANQVSACAITSR